MSATEELIEVRLTEEELQAVRSAVAFAGYTYFAAQGPKFVNDLSAKLTDAVRGE